jgi:hypothetical protein
LRSKWAAGKVVRAGLAFGGRIQPHFFAPEDRQNKREIKKVGLDVTDEQRSRRPIFIATLWAAASWLFFRVARSSRVDSGMLVATTTRRPPSVFALWAMQNVQTAEASIAKSKRKLEAFPMKVSLDLKAEF